MCCFCCIIEQLLVDNILSEIKIDPVSLGISAVNNDVVNSTVDYINDIIGDDGLLSLSLTDVVSIVLALGVLDGDTVTEVVFSFLDEYLTESQYDIIDQEFYRIMKDFTHDENPGYMDDHEGNFVVDGIVEVPLSNLRYNCISNMDLADRNYSFYDDYCFFLTCTNFIIS